MFIKMTQHWRQIIGLENIDLCAVASGVNKFPFLVTIREIFLSSFPHLPRKCPASPGKYYNKNITFTMEHNEILQKAMSPTPFPNGIYRHVIRCYNDDDPIGFALYFHIQINIRLNEERF